METWRDVTYDNLCDLYKVSSTGRIESNERRIVRGRYRTEQILSNRIMKQMLDRKGYLQVGLSNKGKYRSVLVHRTVALAFIPNPFKLPMVNHRDGNKLNNTVSNLEWCTNRENVIHAFRIGLCKRRSIYNLNDDEIKYIQSFSTRNVDIKALSYRFGVSVWIIQQIRKRPLGSKIKTRLSG